MLTNERVNFHLSSEKFTWVDFLMHLFSPVQLFIILFYQEINSCGYNELYLQKSVLNFYAHECRKIEIFKKETMGFCFPSLCITEVFSDYDFILPATPSHIYSPTFILLERHKSCTFTGELLLLRFMNDD